MGFFDGLLKTAGGAATGFLSGGPLGAVIGGGLGLAGALGETGGGGGPQGFFPELNPDALSGLAGLDLSGVNIPRGDALFQAIEDSSDAFSGQRQFADANIARSMEAEQMNAERSRTAGLGRHVDTGDTRTRQLFGASKGRALAESGAKFEGLAIDLAGRKVEQDTTAAMMQIQNMIAENQVSRDNLLANVDQRNKAAGLLPGLVGEPTAPTGIESLLQPGNIEGITGMLSGLWGLRPGGGGGGGEYTGVGSLDYGQNSPEWWNPDIVGPWS